VRRRSRLLVRFVAFLSLVRWTHLAFLAWAQGMAYIFLFADQPSWKALSETDFWFVVISTAGLVAGGSLMNSFYDMERDLVQRPWRTLFERPVAKKYGLRMASVFYFTGLLAAWIGLSWWMALSFTLYGVLIWLYSHKQWNLHQLGPLMATLLAYTPLLLLAFAFSPQSEPGFMRSLPLAIAMIMLEWRRQWERSHLFGLDPDVRAPWIRRQWIYKGLLIAGIAATPFL
jgi:hypothetical protein